MLGSGGLFWRETVTEVLHGDMSVTDYFAARQLLWCCIVRILWVGECTSYQIGGLYLDLKGCIGVDILSRSRVDDDRGDHVVLGWHITHY